MTNSYMTLHPDSDLDLMVSPSSDTSEAYVELRYGGSLITVYLSWDQLDRLIFMAGVVAREHDERTRTAIVVLAAPPAQHIDAINE